MMHADRERFTMQELTVEVAAGFAMTHLSWFTGCMHCGLRDHGYTFRRPLATFPGCGLRLAGLVARSLQPSVTRDSHQQTLRIS